MKRVILAWALALLVMPSADAAIAVDSTSSQDGGINVSYSWSHTCTGANLILIVGVAIVDTGAHTVSGVTYNGVALTQKVRTAGANSNATEIWYLVAPATGANTIAVTLTGAPVQNSMAGAISLTGANQAAPEASNGASGGAPNPTMSITTVADNAWVVDAVSDNNAVTLLAGSGQTRFWLINGNNRTGAGSYEGPKTPAGAVTMDYTAGGSAWTMSAVSIAPATATAAARRRIIQ